jgi:hypothetical protein
MQLASVLFEFDIMHFHLLLGNYECTTVRERSKETVQNQGITTTIFPSMGLSISAGNFICLQAYELHYFFNPQKLSRVGRELCEAVRALPEQELIE